TSSPTIGGVEVNKSVRFIQAKTTGTSPINLGIVEQTTGSSIAGELIIHNQFSGLAYPQSSTFIVNKALSAGKVVLKSGLPLGNCEKSLNEVGSLRLKLVPSTSSTAISKSLLPKNRSSSVYFDVYSIDKSSGEIVVNDPAGLISGASGTVFFAGLYAQGGHANTQLINNMFGGGIEGLPSITIKESALAGKTASLTLRRDISLDM
ncbi:MAG: hypothetical protein KAH32_07395, partial [Chlamydiia bacterium]|nr:hypothetical protein [Chlamydiia bacterium]